MICSLFLILFLLLIPKASSCLHMTNFHRIHTIDHMFTNTLKSGDLHDTFWKVCVIVKFESRKQEKKTMYLGQYNAPTTVSFTHR